MIDHPKVNYGKTGVLLVNLGTPNSTSWWDIRKYLKEFLSDRRVIEVNPIIWQVILNLFILNFRPSKSAKAYKEIWMKEENMSPLLYYTKKQAEKLSKSFTNENLIIDFAMRYGNPSIKSKIKKVFFSINDPDLRSFNKSAITLRSGGVDVSSNILKDEIKFFYKSYFKSKKSNLPFVTCKLAISKDFYTINKKNKWITNSFSRGRVHLMRSFHECVITSSKTVIKDNPKIINQVNFRKGLLGLFNTLL